MNPASTPATAARRKKRRLARSSIVAGVVALIAPLAAVAAPTASAASPTDTYVALGDSYAAGIGIPGDKGIPAGCDRSDRNYASLIAAKLDAANLVDVTCGGATTADMTAPQTVSDGANPPQLDALTPQTDLVTLQIGGNDIGFAEVIGKCVGLSLVAPWGAPCTWSYTAGGVDQLKQRIDATAPKIAATVQAIRDRAPHAKIVLLGYPAILPDKGIGCWPLVPVAYADVSYLRDTEKRLNSMIAAQAAANGATYADVYAPSVGHDACQWSGRWVEGINLDTPFHPNAAGHVGMAAAIEGVLS